MGGEEWPLARRRLCGRGLPPRGRGRAFTHGNTSSNSGITPAWAGKSPVFILINTSCRDYPRVGGEESCGMGVWSGFCGGEGVVLDEFAEEGEGEKCSFHICLVEVFGVNKYLYKSCIGIPCVPHEVPVGDKRGSRGGQTRMSWGTNETLVGDKRETPARSTCGAGFPAGDAVVAQSAHFSTLLTVLRSLRRAPCRRMAAAAG